MPYKYCIVPMCTSSTSTTPDKYFFDTPRNAVIRKRWCSAMKRDEKRNKPLSSKTVRYVCQDHFDLESDVENYMQYRLMGGRMKLKEGIMPHLFECQRQKEGPSAAAERAAKRQRRKTVSDLIKSSEENKAEKFDASSEVGGDLQMLCDSDQVQKQYCDKATQVNFSVPHRSKSTQTSTYIQTSDFQCQVKPLMKDAPCDSFFVLSGKSCDMSCDDDVDCAESEVEDDVHDSDYICEETSDSDFEPEEDDNEFKRKIRECMMIAVTKKPLMCLGIPENARFLIEFLATKCNCSKLNIMITLKKLRMNETYENLGMLFGLSPSSVSEIFKRTLHSLAVVMQNLVIWPVDPLSIRRCLPISFRRRYSKVQSIIDCFEVVIQKPSNVLNQSLTWSDYYKDNTIKYLVSCTPDGTVSFVSRGYGGRATDASIVEDSGYLNLLFPNLEIMADRGFKNIAHLLERKSCKLVRPPSVSNDEPMSEAEVKETKRIAAVRVHVERVIGRLRNFSIISKHTCIDNHLVQLFDQVLIVVCGLANLQSRIINV